MAVAAGHPEPGLALGKHDRVKLHTGKILHADYTAAFLIQVAQLHPGLECLGPELLPGRLRLDPGRVAVHNQRAAGNPGTALGHAVHLTEAVPQVGIELPPGQRLRRIGLRRLVALLASG